MNPDVCEGCVVIIRADGDALILYCPEHDHYLEASRERLVAGKNTSTVRVHR